MADFHFKNAYQDALFGGLAAIAGKTIVAPIERVKLLLQTQDTLTKIKTSGKRYKGIVDCFVRIIKEEGPLSLWRGNFVNVIRYAPNQALSFGFNGFFQRRLCVYNPETQPRKYMLAYFLAGGLAGNCSMVILYPADFIRLHLATDLGKMPQQRKYTGIADCARKIYHKEGIKGFYRGIPLSWVVVFIYRGVYFGGTSLGKNHLPIINENRLIKFVFYHSLNVLSGVFLHPLDTVRRRLMIQQGKPAEAKDYNNIRETFKGIYEKEGLRGFMKGGLTNALRSMSSTFVMIFFDELTGKKRSNKE